MVVAKSVFWNALQIVRVNHGPYLLCIGSQTFTYIGACFNYNAPKGKGAKEKKTHKLLM
jgi:hypothetical protein